MSGSDLYDARGHSEQQVVVLDGKTIDYYGTAYGPGSMLVLVNAEADRLVSAGYVAIVPWTQAYNQSS